jgi:prophage superinfection immunity protein|nr:MAG TPA: protein of unknown function (DUF4352) [Caudoviricetes sp.]
MKKSRILLSALLSSAVVLAGCSSSTDKSSSSNKTEKKEEKKNSNEAKLGTPIAFDKEVEITVKTAAWTDERNQFADKPAKKVLLVTYDVKNLSDKDYPVGTDIKLYVNGKKAESYPVQVKLDSISPNRVSENVTQAFAVNEDGSLELEVQPTFSFKDKKIIKLDLK